MAPTGDGRPPYRDRAIDGWLGGLHGGEVLLGSEQLTALLLAVQRDKHPKSPKRS